jgi:hypothetical protein
MVDGSLYNIRCLFLKIFAPVDMDSKIIKF